MKESHCVVVAYGRDVVVEHPDGCECNLASVVGICGVAPGRYEATPDQGPATIPGWQLERVGS